MYFLCLLLQLLDVLYIYYKSEHKYTRECISMYTSKRKRTFEKIHRNNVKMLTFRQDTISFWRSKLESKYFHLSIEDTLRAVERFSKIFLAFYRRLGIFFYKLKDLFKVYYFILFNIYCKMEGYF